MALTKVTDNMLGANIDADTLGGSAASAFAGVNGSASENFSVLTLTAAGDVRVDKHIYFDGEVANSTGTAINWTNGNKQSIAPSAASNPTYTFTAPTGPTNLTLKATNLGAAGTVTWPASVKWPSGTEPTWTSSGTDIISFYYDGTNYYGAAGLDFS